LLLLAFFVIFFSAFAAGLVYSIFNTILDVAEIETDKLGVFVGEVEPVPVENELPEKDKEKGGGGGGGGRDEKTPTSKGREAAQVPNPLIAPDTSMTKLSNPTIPIQAATTNKNERKAEVNDLPYGLRNGADLLSNGMGTGGGQGEGRGRGQGTGIGNGLGSGIGNGRGSGQGNGEGDGRGDGRNDIFNNVSVTKKPVGPTVGVQILSKPRANYTNEARQQQIQGTVILRVTFLANGTIGGITTIKGLGGGLTEQAIAAARNIKFEPAKRGGVPYSVAKTIEYNFNIY
jgi:TonB family protein